MPKLTDLQSLLLAHAAGRDSGSLYALPESVTAEPARAMKAIAQLLNRGLLAEREVGADAPRHRSDGDLGYGVFITAAGLTAIGVLSTGQARAPAVAPVDMVDRGSAPARVTKAATVLALLARDAGATLPELVAATGWLPHTTRAALTGLRKRGHAIERISRDGVTCYRITVAA